MFWRSRQREDDLERELQSHLDLEAEDRGGDYTAARRALGNVTRIKEETRVAWGWATLAQCAREVRFAIRNMFAHRLFAAFTILSLALCIGANTAVFSIADAILFRPMPYPEPERVFLLMMQDRKTLQYGTLVTYDQLKSIDELPGFTEVAYMDGPGGPVGYVDGVQALNKVQVTPNYFDVLEVKAYRGRTFLPDDDAASGRLALLTYEAFQERLGGDESLIGTTVHYGGTSFDLLGVLPPKLILPSMFGRYAELIRLKAPPRQGESGNTFHPIVRLTPGTSQAEAQTEIDALVPPSSTTEEIRLTLVPVQKQLFFFGRPVSGFLLAAAGLVLLIGCANLTIMFLVRGQNTLRETGVRIALGGTRAQLVRPMIIEACLLGLTAAALALLMTKVSFGLLLAQVPESIYINAPVGISTRVVLFTLGLGLLGGLIFSALPAYRSTSQNAQNLILGRVAPAYRRHFLGQPLIALQVALAVVLVFGASLVTREFVELLNAPLGFDPENVLVVEVNPTGVGIAKQDFYLHAMEILSKRGDVDHVGATLAVPRIRRFSALEAVESPGGTVGIYHALPGFFETISVPLLRGRLWTHDDISANTAIVSETTARMLDPEGNGLGATFQDRFDRTFTVVGVVADIPDGYTSPPAFIIPGEDPKTFLRLLVAMHSRNPAALAEIRDQVSQLAPGRSVKAAWLSDSIEALAQYRNPRFQSMVLDGFGGLALILTALGIFAVVAFYVTIRRHEIGIRRAVGAKPASLTRMILRQSLAPVIVGISVGLLATRWARTLLEAYLGEMPFQSTATLIAAILTVIAVSAVAAYLPARRASRADLMGALRQE